MHPTFLQHQAVDAFAGAYGMIGWACADVADALSGSGRVELHGAPTLETIRDIRERSSLALTERVFFIVNADTMHWAAVPALLKIIEEPPPGHHFILVASGADSIPDTIRSRVVMLFRDRPRSTGESVRAFLALSLKARGAWIEACADDAAQFQRFLDDYEALGRTRGDAAFLRRACDTRAAERSLNIGRKLCLEYLTSFL